MATRYGRLVHGRYEYYDTLDALQRVQSSEYRTYISRKVGIIGLFMGAILAYLFLESLGVALIHWPKLARVAFIIAGSALAGFLGARYAIVIERSFLFVMRAAIFIGLGALVLLFLWNIT